MPSLLGAVAILIIAWTLYTVGTAMFFQVQSDSASHQSPERESVTRTREQ